MLAPFSRTPDLSRSTVTGTYSLTGVMVRISDQDKHSDTRNFWIKAYSMEEKLQPCPDITLGLINAEKDSRSEPCIQ